MTRKKLPYSSVYLGSQCTKSPNKALFNYNTVYPRHHIFIIVWVICFRHSASGPHAFTFPNSLALSSMNPSANSSTVSKGVESRYQCKTNFGSYILYSPNSGFAPHPLAHTLMWLQSVSSRLPCQEQFEAGQHNQSGKCLSIKCRLDS